MTSPHTRPTGCVTSVTQNPDIGSDDWQRDVADLDMEEDTLKAQQ